MHTMGNRPYYSTRSHSFPFVPENEWEHVSTHSFPGALCNEVGQVGRGRTNHPLSDRPAPAGPGPQSGAGVVAGQARVEGPAVPVLPPVGGRLLAVPATPSEPTSSTPALAPVLSLEK